MVNLSPIDWLEVFILDPVSFNVTGKFSLRLSKKGKVCLCSKCGLVRDLTLGLLTPIVRIIPHFFSCAPPSTSQPGLRNPNPHFKNKEKNLQQSFVLSPSFNHAQITRTRMTITTSTKYHYNATKLRTSFHF